MAPSYAYPPCSAPPTFAADSILQIHGPRPQVLCTLKAWESADYCRDRLGRSKPLGSIDRSKLNIRGSSIAVGHPFGATGARILAVAARLFEDLPDAKRGLISVCTAGGMGVTAIVERA